MSKKIAILGLGWLGLPLTKTLSNKGLEVVGSITSAEKLMRLLKVGFPIRIIKIRKNNIEGNWKKFIANANTLVICMPPGQLNNEPENYWCQIEQICNRCSSSVNVIFVSSTSVYADSNEIITEKDEPNPTKKSGEIIVAAEKIILDHFGDNATLVRFAGLFGEGRHPGRFINPEKPLPNPNGRVNLIHQKDCIQLIEAIIEKDVYGEIINGCADKHPIRHEFYKKATENLGIDMFEYDPEEAPSGKIISNEKSKSTLGITYSFADPMQFFD